MLACLPASGEPAVRLLPRTQMNTGLQKWETTQKMRSATHPSPAELDAYAKRVANKPLTIQIFPNSIKVPQKKHVRRTVNGLDSSTQRHSPYPPQVASGGGGLLAVLRAPLRGLVKQPDGCRTRQQLRAVMNPQSGPYAAPSTLNLPHPAPHLAGLSQKQAAVNPQQNLAHPMAVQQRNMAHAQALQQQSLAQLHGAPQHRLAHPPGVQRQPHPQEGQSCSSIAPQQRLSHLPTLKHQTAPPQALLAQQGATQDLRHVSDGGQLQGLQAVPPGPPTLSGGLQQPLSGPYGPRKLPDADAPPNVTVSTSTIPLSMAASLHQNRPGDLSSIVLQINQLCQARAGMGNTSVCEGQIANPSPISRNQLISASSRVSSQHAGVGGISSCLMMGQPDKATAQTAGAGLHPPPGAAANNNLASFHSDGEKVPLQQMQHHLQQQKHVQQLQQQQRSWAQHQLAHMQQAPEGAQPCKNPRIEPPAECAFPSHSLSYGHKLASSSRAFPLKHPAEKTLPPSPASCSVGPASYMNGHYMQPSWSGVPTPTGNNGNIPQDLPVGFQGGHASTDRIPGAKYRPGKDGTAGQSKLMQQSVDFLGEDFQIPNLQEQNMEMMHKMHRSTLGHVKEPGGGGVHSHHPGYH